MEEQAQYTPEVPVEAPPVETPQEAAPEEKPKVEFDSEVLLKKVENLAKENKNLIRSQQAMADQFKTMVDATVRQRVAELMQVRDEAIDLGDRQRVREIDAQIRTVESQAANVPAKGVDPAIASFVEEQKTWFNKDQEMTDFAVAFNESYLKRNPGAIEKSLEETLKKVKAAFPDKFVEEKKAPPSPVEPAQRASSNNKYAVGKLTPEQKIAYEQYVKKHKLMSHDEYFKSLEDAGYLQ